MNTTAMSLDHALALADHASPTPEEAHRALLTLREHVRDLEHLTKTQTDDAAVDAFAVAMKDKLARARAKGRGGWADHEPGMQQKLSDMLREHVAKGDPVDVANFSMFLQQRGESILPSLTRVDDDVPETTIIAALEAYQERVDDTHHSEDPLDAVYSAQRAGIRAFRGQHEKDRHG
ncbi:MAG: hypothetical protein ACREPQ_00710 [Rhodanobacter sp.]